MYYLQCAENVSYLYESKETLGMWAAVPFSPCFVSLPPTTKLGQGYIFTGICDSVHGGGCLVRGGLLPGGAGLLLGVPGGDPPGTATAAGGTHPTGMHSCFPCFYQISQNSRIFPVYYHFQGFPGQVETLCLIRDCNL